MFNKKIVTDMILNIIAGMLPIAVTQLLIYPIMARYVGGDSYGLLLTIYSLWIMISNSLGNVLNNVRLLYNQRYKEENIEGDFNIKLKIWGILNVIIIGTISIIYYGKFSFLNILVGTITSCLILLKAYLEVGFRIKLDYKKIVVNNFIQSIGLIIGCYIAIKVDVVEIVFLSGYLLSTIYCIKNTGLLKEKSVKTKYYKEISHDSYNLTFATVVANLMVYADKLVLFPLMGGHAVSVYYTATIIGKIFSMLTSPINSVILSYISKWNERKNNVFKNMLIVGSFVAVVSYIFTIMLSKPIISILFPQFVDEVMTYIPVTSIGVSLTILISTIQPFVLKFCNMKWQIFINGLSVITYFVAALSLWSIWGLMGFCIGTVIGISVKLSTILLVYKYTSNQDSIKKKEKENAI